MKTHLSTKVPMSTERVSACGRGRHIDTSAAVVDCLLCQHTDAYLLAKDEQDSERHREFMAQTPRELSEPWRDATMVCSNCAGTFFRIGNRTCYGHYQNYTCAKCSHNESRLTETGMSF